MQSEKEEIGKQPTISLEESIETVECGQSEITVILAEKTGEQRNRIILNVNSKHQTK